jgi:hypothetical protein
MNNIIFIKKNTLIKKITKTETLKIYIKKAKEVPHASLEEVSDMGASY